MTEEWYDDVIAPKLREVAKECEAKGCALVAVVEYAPGQRGSTLYTPHGSGLEMLLLRTLDKAGRNLDSFFISVARYCNANGIDTSGSMILSRFGRTGNEEGVVHE